MEQFLNFLIITRIDFVDCDIAGGCVTEGGFVADFSFAFVGAVEVGAD